MQEHDPHRRYIIFDGPAYEDVKDIENPLDWQWERFDLSRAQCAELGRRPSPFLSQAASQEASQSQVQVTAEQGVDADITERQDDDVHLASAEEDLSSSGAVEMDEAPAINATGAGPSLPSQHLMSQRQILSQSMVQPSQRQMDRSLLRNILDRANDTTLLDSQASSLGDESLGPPPMFIWDLSSLTTFDKFRDVLAHHATLRRRSKPLVSFLAAIIDMQGAREMGTSGKTKAEWYLIDPSGQQVTLGIWGTGADDVCSLVRRGDIVFIGDARLGQWRDKLELSVNHDGSTSLKGWQLQIVWRSHIACEEDYDHRVNPALRAIRGQAGFEKTDRVLQVVDWYEKAFLRR